MNQQFNLMRFTTAGFEFAATIGLLTGGGVLLDLKLGIMPAFTATGAVLGLIAAIYRLIRQAKQMQAQFKAQQDRSGRENAGQDSKNGDANWPSNKGTD
ncbi:MAG: AtpZ/AtpI family protein [Planctomycetes bacterium]|nr:AtpZ/AtpI family protein [Planctomycetota bacterium]